MPTYSTRSHLIACLRRAFLRCPLRTHALQLARTTRGQYQCAKCKRVFSRKQVQVDHISPVIDPTAGFIDWNTYIARLFTDHLQVMCIDCHHKKTHKDNKKRRK